jgi:enoyl-CoA hydratase
MSNFKVEYEGQVGIITLDRPPVNALTVAAYRELTHLLFDMQVSGGVRAVVLTGAGERAFSAGQDLKEAAAHSHLDVLERQQLVRECLWAIYDCPLPIVAALNGHAVGLGAMLASVCDLILAVDGITLSLPEINVGLLGGAKPLSRMGPPHLVRRMVLTGDRVPAAVFARYGSIEILPREQLLPAAKALASSLAAKPSAALALAKRALNQGEKLSLKDGYEFEQVLGRELSRKKEE